MPNDLAAPRQLPVAPFTPRTLEEAKAFSLMVSKSEIVPKDFLNKEANIFVAVQWGMELGLHPMQAVQSIAVINGRPSLWGDAVLALVRASGLCQSIREDVSDESATCYTTRVGETEVSRTFTKADAVKAGLWGKGGPWTTYTKRMLQMRARSWCLRDVYPDVLRGVSVAEEVRDTPVEPEKDVTPQAAAPAGGIQQPAAKSSKAAPVDAEIVTKAKVEPKADAAKPEAKAEPKPAEQPTGDFTTKASAGQLAHIRKKAEAATITEAEIVAEFKLVDGDGEPVKNLDGISVGTGNMILQFLSDPVGFRGGK